MAKDLNYCGFIGRLGKDPETRNMPSGSSVCNFSIACSDDYKPKDGSEMVQRTNWVNIVAFGKLGDICGKYLHKGSRVYVAGKFVTRKWQDDSGNNRYATEIHLSDMQMLDTKQDGGNNQQNNAQQGNVSNISNAKPAQQNDNYADFDSDIPF